MKLDGRNISDSLLRSLVPNIAALKKNRTVPTLAIILIGNDPASLSYIRQKQKAADTIGAKLIFNNQQSTINNQQLHTIIRGYNENPNIHGIILQRPLPVVLKSAGGRYRIRPGKDVDGFQPDSPFIPPVSLAVLTLLSEALAGERKREGTLSFDSILVEIKNKQFIRFLRSKKIVIIGRGETAGKPIAASLAKLQCATSIIHRKTPKPEQILHAADIIISCVGKERVVQKRMIHPGAILIGVGLWRDRDGKLRGDYEEGEVRDIASFYTPTPGGVGPVNVACLMENLVLAAQHTR